MDHRAIEKAADLLWQARLAGRRLAALPEDCRPRALDDGYAIQDAMAAHAGKAVVGWKLAVTSQAGQRRLGISEPLAGRLFDGFVLDDNARLDAGPMSMRVVEPEFAFRLGRDLPPRERAYGMDEVMAAVEDLHLAIELPDSRFARFAEMGAADMVADDGFAGWFITGPKLEDWRGLDLSTLPVRAIRNGRVASEGCSAHTLGDPRRQLTWLAQDRARRGGGLAAGDIVTTGTCCAPVEILPGDRVTVEFADLGKVGVAFD
jgi:2-keto-4-pentenoate hydratase